MASLPDAFIRTIAPSMGYGISAVAHLLVLGSAAFSTSTVTYDDAAQGPRLTYAYAARAYVARAEEPGDAMAEGAAEGSARDEKDAEDQVETPPLTGKPFAEENVPRSEPWGKEWMSLDQAQRIAGPYLGSESEGRGGKGTLEGTAEPARPPLPVMRAGAKKGGEDKPENRVCPKGERGRMAWFCRRPFSTYRP